MARALNLLLVASTLGVGCIDLTESPTVPNSMTVEVFMSDGLGEEGLRVQGRLTLAPAFWDSPSAIESDALVINGVPIKPTAPAVAPQLSYEATWSVAARPPIGDVITIEPPRIATESPCMCGVTATVVQRGGDADLVLPLGDDLVLSLAQSSTEPDPPAVSRTWRLDILAPGHNLAVIDQGGVPARTLTVPADWLTSFPDTFRVDLELRQVVRSEGPSGSYRVSAAIRQTMSWNVTRPILP